jgi:hypothetical protein
VRYRAEGKPLWVAHCHCADCRRSSGGVMTTWVGYWEEAVAFVHGEPTSYASSPGVERLFCGRCGTPLTYAAEKYPRELHLMVGTFDDPDDLVPEVHVWTAEKVSWLAADAHLPMKPQAGGMPRKKD